MKKNNSKLKIAIILKKKSQKHYLYPSIKKMQIFIRSEAERYFKNGFKITIRVTYGSEINVFGKKVVFMNVGTYNSIDGLKWAYIAFIKDYLQPEHD